METPYCCLSEIAFPQDCLYELENVEDGIIFSSMTEKHIDVKIHFSELFSVSFDIANYQRLFILTVYGDSLVICMGVKLTNVIVNEWKWNPIVQFNERTRMFTIGRRNFSIEFVLKIDKVDNMLVFWKFDGDFTRFFVDCEMAEVKKWNQLCPRIEFDDECVNLRCGDFTINSVQRKTIHTYERYDNYVIITTSSTERGLLKWYASDPPNAPKKEVVMKSVKFVKFTNEMKKKRRVEEVDE